MDEHANIEIKIKKNKYLFVKACTPKLVLERLNRYLINKYLILTNKYFKTYLRMVEQAYFNFTERYENGIRRRFTLKCADDTILLAPTLQAYKIISFL